MNRGWSAESPIAWRSLFSVVLRLASKSTKVSAGHNRCRNSSRVTIRPACSSSRARTCNSFSCSLNLAPCLRISPVRSSTSKVPKRTHRGDWSGSLMGRSTNARFHFTMRYGAGSDSPKHPQLEKPDPGLTVRSRDADLHPFPISYLDEDSFVLFHLSSQQLGTCHDPPKYLALARSSVVGASAHTKNRRK